MRSEEELRKQARIVNEMTREDQRQLVIGKYLKEIQLLSHRLNVINDVMAGRMDE